jgi:hypothetical protein
MRRLLLFDVLTDEAAANALEAVYECAYRDFWWVVHQQVDVIIFAIKLNQFGFKVFADVGKDDS